jgi:predicted dehydrogenase
LIYASLTLTPPIHTRQGCIGDLGWYNIRFALWAFGFELPATASAVCQRAAASGVPLDATVILTWADGRVCHWDNSFTTAFRQWAEVAGETGVLRLDDFVIARSHESAVFNVATEPGLSERHDSVVGASTTTDTLGCNPEAEMWRHFADEVFRRRRSGSSVSNASSASGGDSNNWLTLAGMAHAPLDRQMLLTQAVTDAVMRSIAEDGRRVAIVAPK